MKNVQKILMVLVLISGTMLASAQSNTDVKQILSKPETRKTIMDAIANDSIMSKEMMTTMMNSKNHQMMMMKNHGSMMKDNPGMKHCMMYQMMEECKGDTSMMSAKCKAMMEGCKGDTTMMKCKAMMENQQGKEMMHKRMKDAEDKKNIEGVDKTKLEVVKPKK